MGLLAVAALSGCGFGGGGGSGELTIYSGREQDLVGPLLDRYAKQEGVDIKVLSRSAIGLRSSGTVPASSSPLFTFSVPG